MNWLICLIVGHRPGWIPAPVPNPWAIRSEIWGCKRCGRVMTGKNA